MPRCNIRTPLRNIQNSIYGLLDSMSIADMKEFGSATIVPQSRVYGQRT
jgi:DNA-binding IscR family transcriptional regulator